MRVCARCNTPVGNGAVCPKCGSTSFAYANDFSGSDDTVILDSGSGSVRPQTPQMPPQRRQAPPQRPIQPAVQQRPVQAPPQSAPAPIQQAPMQPAPAAAGVYQQYPKKKNTGLIIGIAAGAGAFFLILLIVIIAVSTRSTPEKTVRQFEKAFNNRNVTQMMELLSYDMRSYTDYDDLVEFVYEDNYNLDINITGKYQTGYNEYTVYGTIKFSNSWETESGTCEFTLIKEGGKWKIDDLDMEEYDYYDFYSYDPNSSYDYL